MPKKKTKKARNTRRVTAKIKQDIFELAKVLVKFIPASSYSKSSLSFDRIVREKQIPLKYWKPASNREKRVAALLENLYRYKPYTIHSIVRTYIAEAIEKRRNNGDPVNQEDIDELSKGLLALGIMLTAELDQLKLPSDSDYLTPPPKKLQNALKNISLHKLLMKKVIPLYLQGNYNESVRKAAEVYENRVQRLTEMERIGTDLMMNAFNQDNAIFQIADTDTRDGRALQEGYKFLASGMMGYWRNMFSHGDRDSSHAHIALEALAFISSMLRALDNQYERHD